MPTPVETFWSKIDKRGPGACWPWNGTRNSKGYGMWKIAGIRARTAHRIAWTLTHGAPQKDSDFVCHTCDNPPCCNPAHLFVADNAENMRDMYRKGRRIPPTGAAHHNAKLSEEQRAAVLADPRGCTSVARDYGVTEQTIYRIRKANPDLCVPRERVNPWIARRRRRV